MLPCRMRHSRDFPSRGRHRFSLTFRARERRPLFANAQLGALVVDQFLRAAAAEKFDILVYCLMPDHAHLFVRGVDDGSSLEAFVKRAKQLSGYHGKRLVGRSIWQTGYYERLLRLDDDDDALIAYIVRNPVRRGLVERAEDYPLTGSSCLSREDFLRVANQHPPL